MMELVMGLWPRYVTGPLIGLMVPALLLFAGKTWGISGSFRDIGAAQARSMPKSAAALTWPLSRSYLRSAVPIYSQLLNHGCPINLITKILR